MEISCCASRAKVIYTLFTDLSKFLQVAGAIPKPHGTQYLGDPIELSWLPALESMAWLVGKGTSL